MSAGSAGRPGEQPVSTSETTGELGSALVAGEGAPPATRRDTALTTDRGALVRFTLAWILIGAVAVCVIVFTLMVLGADPRWP